MGAPIRILVTARADGRVLEDFGVTPETLGAELTAMLERITESVRFKVTNVPADRFTIEADGRPEDN